MSEEEDWDYDEWDADKSDYKDLGNCPICNEPLDYINWCNRCQQHIERDEP